VNNSFQNQKHLSGQNLVKNLSNSKSWNTARKLKKKKEQEQKGLCRLRFYGAETMMASQGQTG
jgi:hypothetical protein